MSGEAPRDPHGRPVDSHGRLVDPHAHPVGGHAPAEHHAHSGWFYTGIAVFLGVLTFIELGPLFGWYNLPAPVLIALSVVKFTIVVALFMHLWDDDGIFTRVFLAPLIGAALMVMVLMTLMHTWSPSPRDDVFPIAERWGDTYNGTCSSWLVSSTSNRTYCASPPIPQERIAMFLPKGDTSTSGPPAVALAGKSEDEIKAALISRGEQIYTGNCSACHQPTGLGIAGAYPPLAGSDYFQDKTTHAKIVINGLAGPIVVAGKPYNGIMSAFGALSDYNIAAVATYERNSWGNNLGVVLPEDVKAAR